MQEGYDGLLRDRTRPSRIQPLGSTITERLVVMLTQTDPPAEATHWTSAMMATIDITSLRDASGVRTAFIRTGWSVQGLHRSAACFGKLRNPAQSNNSSPKAKPNH